MTDTCTGVMTQSLVKYYLFIFLLMLGSIAVYGQQGFGTNNPSKASAVEMESSNRGLLIPRVALVELTNFAPITGETATNAAKTNSLLVYNTADIDADIFPGYYYWSTDGISGQWVRLLTGEDIDLPWNIEETTDRATDNEQNIYQSGNVGIGDFSGEAISESLDVKEGNLRVRAINENEGDVIADRVVVADPNGVLKTVSAAMPKIFYPPSIIFDTSVNYTFQRNLYNEYVSQYGTPMISSSGSAGSIPTYAANQLEYYITYYDTDVLDNLSIDANGVLTYDVIGPGSGYTFMNIVFVVKDDE